MTTWTTARIGDLAAPEPNALSTGPFGSAISSRFFVDHGVPVIRGSNLSTDVGVRVNDSGLAFLEPEKAAQFKRSIARRGDLIFTCWGTVGQVGLIDDNARFDEYIVSNKQMKLTPDGERVDSLFLYYLMSSPSMVAAVQRNAIGAAVPGFNLGQLRELEVTIPGLPDQRAIAATLGALDDKIESNRRLIELSLRLLDALAADSALGVPLVRLADLVMVAKDTVNPATFGTESVDHFSLPAFDDGGRPDRVAAEAIMSNKLLVPGRCILLSRLNPRINRTWWVTPHEGIAALSSTEFLCMRAGSDTELAAVWLALRSEIFLDELPARVTGTSGSHQRVRPDDVLAIEVPDVSRLPESVKQTALSLVEGAEQRTAEIAHLAALRDVLLPELLSGGVRVPEDVQAVAGVGE